jgi:hypothetical protein
MQEASTLKDVYDELEEAFLLPRKVAYQGRRNKRSILSLVSFALGGIVDIATLVSVNQMKSKVKLLSANMDELIHATSDAFSILNVTQEEVHQNRLALNYLGEEIQRATNQLNRAFSELQERTLRELYYTMVISQVQSYFNIVQNALRRAFNQLIMLRADLTSGASGRMSFGLVTRDQLRTTIRKIENQLPEGYHIPIDEHDLGPLYRNGGVMMFSLEKRLYTTMAIPVARRSTAFDVYRLISVPHLREDLGVTFQYKLSETGIAISKDKLTYQLMSAPEATLCGNQGTTYCILEKPMYSVTRNPSCLSALFMKRQANIDRLCEAIRHTGPEHTVARYLLDGTWLVSSIQDFTLSQVCNPREGDTHHEAADIRVRRGSNLIRLLKGCRATSDILTLPTYFSSSSNEQIKGKFNSEFSRMREINLFSNQSTYFGHHGGLTTLNFTGLPNTPFRGEHTIEDWINHWGKPREPSRPGWGGLTLALTLSSVIVYIAACTGMIIWVRRVRKRGRSLVDGTPNSKHQKAKARNLRPSLMYRKLPPIPAHIPTQDDPGRFNRCCVDFRNLNDTTLRGAVPLPKIENLIRSPLYQPRSETTGPIYNPRSETTGPIYNPM